MLEMILENSEMLLAIGAIIGGVITKLLTDQGKKSLVKELDEAKLAMEKMAKDAAPGWDLAFNIGTGKVPFDDITLRKLTESAMISWVNAKALSKEAKDVLDQFAEKKGVLKP